MKRFAFLFVCLIVLASILCPMTARAAEGDPYGDGTFTYMELADGTLCVTGYTGGGGAVDVPTSFGPDSVPVTSVGEEAFFRQPLHHLHVDPGRRDRHRGPGVCRLFVPAESRDPQRVGRLWRGRIHGYGPGRGRAVRLSRLHGAGPRGRGRLSVPRMAGGRLRGGERPVPGALRREAARTGRGVK